jgi:hypothetical protein
MNAHRHCGTMSKQETLAQAPANDSDDAIKKGHVGRAERT